MPEIEAPNHMLLSLLSHIVIFGGYLSSTGRLVSQHPLSGSTHILHAEHFLLCLIFS